MYIYSVVRNVLTRTQMKKVRRKDVVVLCCTLQTNLELTHVINHVCCTCIYRSILLSLLVYMCTYM